MLPGHKTPTTNHIRKLLRAFSHKVAPPTRLSCLHQPAICQQELSPKMAAPFKNIILLMFVYEFIGKWVPNVSSGMSLYYRPPNHPPNLPSIHIHSFSQATVNHCS